MGKLLGAQIGNFHTLKDWGLYLKVGSPKIGPAEVDDYLVQVPGSDTLLNLTSSLDGRPHYKKRTISSSALHRKSSGRTSTALSQTPSTENGFSVNSTMTPVFTGRGCGMCPSARTNYTVCLRLQALATPSSAVYTTALMTGCGMTLYLIRQLSAIIRISSSKPTRTSP